MAQTIFRRSRRKKENACGSVKKGVIIMFVGCVCAFGQGPEKSSDSAVVSVRVNRTGRVLAFECSFLEYCSSIPDNIEYPLRATTGV